MQTEMVNCVFTHFFGGVARRQAHLDTWIFLWVNYRNFYHGLPWCLCSLSLSLYLPRLPVTNIWAPHASLPTRTIFPCFLCPSRFSSQRTLRCSDPIRTLSHVLQFRQSVYNNLSISQLFVIIGGLIFLSFIRHYILCWCFSNIVRKTITSIKFFETEIERTGSVTSARVFKRSSRFCIGYIARDLDKPIARHDKLRGNSRPVLRETIGWALRVIRLSYTKGKISRL